MTEAEIRKAFYGKDLQPRIALDHDIDIAPIFADGDTLFATFSGASIADAISYLAKSEPFLSAKSVVINIITGPNSELKMSDLSPFNDFLSTLPDDAEVLWGMAVNPEQPLNVTVNILIKINN